MKEFAENVIDGRLQPTLSIHISFFLWNNVNEVLAPENLQANSCFLLNQSKKLMSLLTKPWVSKSILTWVKSYQIQNIYAVKKILDRESLLILIHALAISWVNYYNFLLVGPPSCLLKKFWCVLISEAKLLFSLPPRGTNTPFLIERHWLPIKNKIKFTLHLMSFKVTKFFEPTYLVNLLRPLSISLNTWPLHSANSLYCLTEPRAVSESSFIVSSFSYTTLRLCNGLPITLKQLDSVEIFTKHLKTFFFFINIWHWWSSGEW